MAINYDFKYEVTNDGLITLCTMKDTRNNILVTGKAKLHPDDKDMSSRKTGETIAMKRATIAYYEKYINYVLKPELKAYNNLLSCLNSSDKYNKKSNEIYLLYRQINHVNRKIKAVKTLIQNQKNSVKTYINDKDTFYNLVRTTVKNNKNN